MLIKLNYVDLKLFSQKLLAQRFKSPVFVLKYYNLVLNQNQTIYDYIFAAFERRQKFLKKLKMKKKHKIRFYKPRVSKILRFIKRASSKKKKYEKYINNKLDYIDRSMPIIDINEYNKKKLKKLYTTKKKLSFDRFYLKQKDEYSFADNGDTINKNKKIKKYKKNIKKKKTKKDISLDLRELAQLKSNRLLIRFRNLFAKKGNLLRAEKVVFRASYIMKLCFKKRKVKAKVWNIPVFKKKQQRKSIRLVKKYTNKSLVNKFFLKVLASARPVLWLKSIKKGKSFIIQKPISLSLQRSTSLGQRGILYGISRRSERSITKRIASEFIAVYKRKPSQTQNNLSVLHKNLRSSYALL